MLRLYVCMYVHFEFKNGAVNLDETFMVIRIGPRTFYSKSYC